MRSTAEDQARVNPSWPGERSHLPRWPQLPPHRHTSICSRPPFLHPTIRRFHSSINSNNPLQDSDIPIGTMKPALGNVESQSKKVHNLKMLVEWEKRLLHHRHAKTSTLRNVYPTRILDPNFIVKNGRNGKEDSESIRSVIESSQRLVWRGKKRHLVAMRNEGTENAPSCGF